MKLVHEGFLLVETMVMFTLISFFIAVLIQYQVRSYQWQSAGIALMQIVVNPVQLSDNERHQLLNNSKCNYYRLSDPEISAGAEQPLLNLPGNIQLELYSGQLCGPLSEQVWVIPKIVCAHG